MATITYAGRIEKGRQYMELAGTSEETKRTKDVLGGSLFHEMDTRRVFAYDQENDTWRYQMTLAEEDPTAENQSSLSAAPTLQLGGQMRPAVQQPIPTLDLDGIDSYNPEEEIPEEEPLDEVTEEEEETDAEDGEEA